MVTGPSLAPLSRTISSGGVGKGVVLFFDDADETGFLLLRACYGHDVPVL